MADYFMQTQPLPRMSAVTPLSFTNRSQSRLNTRDGKIEELYDRVIFALSSSST